MPKKKGNISSHSKQKGGNDISNTSESSIPTINRIPYDIKIFSFLCIMGVLVRMIFANQNDYATATIWGYGFSILALFGLIISSFAMSSKTQITQGISGFLKVIVTNALPIIFTLIIISLILAQNITFYDHINSGKVAPQYYQFSSVSGFLILVQVCLVIKFLMDTLKSKEVVDKNASTMLLTLASELNSIILILTAANIGFVGILQVILKYFSTDG
jgi:hypothetical protein